MALRCCGSAKFPTMRWEKQESRRSRRKAGCGAGVPGMIIILRTAQEPFMDQDDYSLAPLFVEREEAPVSVCLVVRRKHDPASGWFVALYQLLDATVFLGCLCDERVVR